MDISNSEKPILRIMQVGSPIRRNYHQQLYLKSLGLGKINRLRSVVNNSCTRGLLVKLKHMVVIVD